MCSVLGTRCSDDYTIINRNPSPMLKTWIHKSNALNKWLAKQRKSANALFWSNEDTFYCITKRNCSMLIANYYDRFLWINGSTNEQRIFHIQEKDVYILIWRIENRYCSLSLYNISYEIYEEIYSFSIELIICD